jgi:hypothetical protein
MTPPKYWEYPARVASAIEPKVEADTYSPAFAAVVEAGAPFISHSERAPDETGKIYQPMKILTLGFRA